MCVVALAAACPAPTMDGETMTAGTTGSGSTTGGSTAGGSTQGATSAPTTGVTTVVTTGDGPSGACLLEGMFVDCTVDGVAGVAYCDEIGGELQWGPCLTDPACELGEFLPGCQSCALIEGVPTIEGSPTCECEGPGEVPVCAQTECLQRWHYSCGECQNIVDGTCFSYSEGCASPWLGCGFASPCPRVWAFGGASWDMLTELEDESAAVCVLTALRDGTVGNYEILWGEMGDIGWVTELVHVHGNGTATVEWAVDCPGCLNFGNVGRSGALQLQPTSWFDDCLADPTVENLIHCTVGLVGFDVGAPPPEGYAPPFTTGECASLEPACP